MTYLITLSLHSWVRWLVLLAGFVAVARAISGTRGRRGWTAADDRAGFFFTMLLDLQVLMGVILYVGLSPITREALRDFSGAMKSTGLRFFAVEHVFGMIVALALAHVGRVRIRKAALSRRHKIALTFFGLAFLAILASIPWPGTPYARPLLRW
jgi:hypothetical protein